MISKQLLTITFQNDQYILIKLEHPSLYGEGCSYYYFFLFSISDNIEVENFNFFIY